MLNNSKYVYKMTTSSASSLWAAGKRHGV